MAVTAKWYGQALLKALAGAMNLTADDVRAALLGSSYTPDQDAHAYWADVKAAEISGPGYTAGGVALASKALTYDPASNTVKLAAANPSWNVATLTPRYAVYYDRTPATDAARPLLAFVDFGADVPVVGGTFTLDVSAGIATVTPA